MISFHVSACFSILLFYSLCCNIYVTKPTPTPPTGARTGFFNVKVNFKIFYEFFLEILTFILIILLTLCNIACALCVKTKYVLFGTCLNCKPKQTRVTCSNFDILGYLLLIAALLSKIVDHTGSFFYGKTIFFGGIFLRVSKYLPFKFCFLSFFSINSVP